MIDIKRSYCEDSRRQSRSRDALIGVIGLPPVARSSAPSNAAGTKELGLPARNGDERQCSNDQDEVLGSRCDAMQRGVVESSSSDERLCTALKRTSNTTQY